MNFLILIVSIALFALFTAHADQPVRKKGRIPAYYIVGVKVSLKGKRISESRMVVAPSTPRMMRENKDVRIRVTVSDSCSGTRDATGVVDLEVSSDGGKSMRAVPVSPFHIPVSMMYKYKTRYPELLSEVESTPFTLQQTVAHGKEEYLVEMGVGLISSEELRSLAEIGEEKGDGGLEF